MVTSLLEETGASVFKVEVDMYRTVTSTEWGKSKTLKCWQFSQPTLTSSPPKQSIFLNFFFILHSVLYCTCIFCTIYCSSVNSYKLGATVKQYKYFSFVILIFFLSCHFLKEKHWLFNFRLYHAVVWLICSCKSPKWNSCWQIKLLAVAYARLSEHNTERQTDWIWGGTSLSGK